MKSNKANLFLDFLVIIVEFTYPMSLVKVWTLDLFPMPHGINLFLFMLITYMIRFNRNVFNMQIIKESNLLKLLVIILVVDIFQATIHLDPAGMFSTFIYILNIIIFVNYLSSIVNEKSPSIALSLVIKPYLGYSLYNVVVILLSAVLIIIGILNPTGNEITMNSMISDNVTNGNMRYYFPGYLSLVTSDFRVLSLFNVPVLTGLSHEPHVLCFLIFPSFFLFLSYANNPVMRTLIYVLALAILMLSYSTTALLFFAVLLITDIVWNFSVSRRATNIIFIIIILFILIRFYETFWSLIQIELLKKTAESSGSLDYSSSMLKYVISPSGILGYGNLPRLLGEDVSARDIGVISCILDVSFYISLLLKSARLTISRIKHIHYIGLACLYFALHSLKCSFMVFRYPYLVFIVFIIYLANKELEESKMR